MKISFLWMTAIVLHLPRIVFSKPLDVGTVLFTRTDLVKRCWSQSDKSLLRARLIMQDVLPDPDCIDFNKPGVVTTLLDYFQSCYGIISTSTYGKLQNLMFLALSDALGGYLRSYVLPLTRRAYYAGQVKYSEAKKLFQMYDDIKVFLKTSGEGWAKPRPLFDCSITVKPLVITNAAGRSACNRLYTIKKKKNANENHNDRCTLKGLMRLKNRRRLKELLREILELSDVPIAPEVEDKSKMLIYPKLSNLQSKLSKLSLPNSELGELGRLLTESTTEGNSSLRSEAATNVQAPLKRKESKENKEEEKELGRKAALEGEPVKNVEITTKNATDHGGYTVVTDASKESPKNQTKDVSKDSKTKRNCRRQCPPAGQPMGCSSNRIVIPLPVLDDSNCPHTIAVPFRNRPLRNLQSPTSAFIVQRYYATVIECMVSMSNTRNDIKNFNAHFHSWVISQIYPHLEDEKWYPGFGGVLRIAETIRKFGADAPGNDPITHDIAYMFPNGFEFEQTNDVKPKAKARDVCGLEAIETEYCPPKRYFLFGILVLSAASLLTFCACAFYLQALVCRNTCPPCPHGKECGDTEREDYCQNERFLNFQFLVRFFKRHEEHDVCEEKNANIQTYFVSEVRKPPEEITFKQKEEPPCEGKEVKVLECEKVTTSQYEGRREGKGQVVVTGQGDFPAFIISQAEVPQKHFNPNPTPASPCDASFVNFEKIDLTTSSPNLKDSLKNRQPKQLPTTGVVEDAKDKIETVWIKPSIRFGRNVLAKELQDVSRAKGSCVKVEQRGVDKSSEDFVQTGTSESVAHGTEDVARESNTDNSISCRCSESFPNSYVTTTNSSSQVEEKISSTTMKFLKHAKARNIDCSTQESTADSESERDASSSSETDASVLTVD